MVSPLEKAKEEVWPSQFKGHFAYGGHRSNAVGFWFGIFFKELTPGSQIWPIKLYFLFLPPSYLVPKPPPSPNYPTRKFIPTLLVLQCEGISGYQLHAVVGETIWDNCSGVEFATSLDHLKAPFGHSHLWLSFTFPLTFGLHFSS